MKDDILSLGVDVDIASAMRQMDRFEKDMKKRMRNVTRAVDALNKTNIKGIQDATSNFHDWLDEMDDVALAHDNQVKKLEKVIDTIEELRRVQEDAADDQKQAIQDNIDLLEEQARVIGGNVSKKVFARSHFNMVATNIAESMEKGLESAAPVFRSFFSKDLKGFIEDGVKISGKALGFGLTKAASGLVKRGSALKESGERMAQRGKAGGGVGGGAMSLMGTSMKAIGGLATKLGPIIGTLSKMAPIFSALSSSILAVVKVFIDAEAQAKQFQKEILASASTTEFLAGNAGDAAMSMVDLEDTMRGVRDAAHSLDNLAWGINADDHKAVINVLTQEGVSLRRIAQEAEAGQKSIQSFAADLTHVSVAYSRAFGVPLQEVNQLQAEMMVDMGKSLDETRLAFAQMTRSAADSGIAANRFFAIIRGVSQDLSLYNIRMESAIKLLGKLGKVMNPRNAQKFMQTAAQGLKNMSQDDRLKVALLTGGKGAAIVRKDIKNREANLARDIADATGRHWEDIAADLRDPKKAADLWKEVEAKQPSKVGALRESALELGIDKNASQKGVYGQAFAMENLGMGASLDMMREAIVGWGGGKTLMEGAGSIGMTKMSEMLGYSTEQLRGMMKLEVAVEEQKNALLAQATSAAEKDRINAMGTQDLLDTMSEEERKALQEQTKSEADFAREQSHLTNSMSDKLGTLVDFVMNQLYNVMLDIYEAITNLPGFGGKNKASWLRSAKASGNAELMKAAGSGDLNSSLAGTKLVSALNKALDDQSTLGKKYADVEKRKQDLAYAQSKKPALTDKDKQEMAVIDREIESLKKQNGAIRAMKEDMLGQLDLDAVHSVLTNEGKGMGIDLMDQGYKISKAMEEGKTAGEAFKEAGLTEEQITTILRKAPVWSGMSGDQKIAMLGSAGKHLQEAGYYTPDQKKTAEATMEASSATAEATTNLTDHAVSPNTIYTKFSNSFLRSGYRDTVEEAVLSAMRLALFEYYMYSEIEDRAKVAEFLSKGGMQPQDFAKGVGKFAADGQNAQAFLDANAAGGIVTGVNGGIASVRAAAGEGLASIGPGERILPAGAGSTGPISIHVNGVGGRDLAKVIEAKVVDGIAEYKRRERYT